MFGVVVEIEGAYIYNASLLSYKAKTETEGPVDQIMSILQTELKLGCLGGGSHSALLCLTTAVLRTIMEMIL